MIMEKNHGLAQPRSKGFSSSRLLDGKKKDPGKEVGVASHKALLFVCKTALLLTSWLIFLMLTLHRMFLW